MQTPLEISFHNVPPSRRIEDSIRRRVLKLERIYQRLVGCRVSVEALHRQHRTGNVLSVHVEMFVPGGTLAISREPHYVRERRNRPTIEASLRDAFRAAEARLKAFKEQQRGNTKLHTPLFEGRVSQIFRDRDFGYIRTDSGAQLYFHRNSLMDGGFDALKPGEPVNYMESVGETGPAAAKVWVGPDNRLD
ncbi:MAG TPA: HPF/RaiA family ribosome-associated protein [Alphaproteobacteria bacterium]|nr:HPF/RaiA family ribosome-associated protein [Alphaproteobacteria bacterium]